MIDNRPDKRHRFKRSDSFDRQRLTAHGERDARVACLTFVWHFESAPLWSLSTNHNVGRFEPRRSEKWCAHQWKKSSLIVSCGFHVVGLAGGLGNTMVKILIMRSQRREWWIESWITKKVEIDFRFASVCTRFPEIVRNLSRARITFVSSLKSSKFKIKDYFNFSNLRSFRGHSSSGSQRIAQIVKISFRILKNQNSRDAE